MHDGFFQKARDYDSSPLRKRCTVIELLQLDNFVYVGLSPREKNNMPTHAFREPLPLYFELDVFAHKKSCPRFLQFKTRGKKFSNKIADDCRPMPKTANQRCKIIYIFPFSALLGTRFGHSFAMPINSNVLTFFGYPTYYAFTFTLRTEMAK